MNTSQWLIAAAALGVCSLPIRAVASPQELQITPLNMADALAVDQHSQASLTRFANEVGQQVGPQGSRESTESLESLNIPLLNDLLDESGELQLPLGLTVYDAMGTTSVGFGTNF